MKNPDLSTEQAAKLVGISYITLRRWLAAKYFQSSVRLQIGSGKTIWRFTPKDVANLREHKDLYYCKGRGRVPRLRKEVKQERNMWTAKKRFWIRNLCGEGAPEKAKLEMRTARQAKKQYEAAVRQLRKLGYTVACPSCKAAIRPSF